MVQILVSLIIVGVVLYLVNLIPMVDWMKNVINCVAILFVLLWLVQAFTGHSVLHLH